MIKFCPYNFIEKMLIKRNFRMPQIWRLQSKGIQIGNGWFVAVHHFGIALGVNSDTLRACGI